MAIEVYVHKMTEHMETAIILSWLVKDGDAVLKGSPILEVETEKATVDIEAPASGIIKGIRAGATDGVEVKVGETLAFIAETDEIVPELPPLGVIDTKEKKGVEKNKSEKGITSAISKDILATPVARRLAKEIGINLENIQGTGPDGRIREEDIRKIAKENNKGNLETEKRDSERKNKQTELNRIQIITGKKMLESIRTIPQYTLLVEADLSSTIEFREKVKLQKGITLSYNAFFIKSAASALLQHPRINATLEGNTLRFNDLINIGLAVGTEEGLIVPVIRDADNKSLIEINDLVQKYKENIISHRFSNDEITDATFTISNLGMYGINQFNAIINPPQAAILAIGQINQVVSVIPVNLVAIRPKVILSLTVDHRFIDGFHASQFLHSLVSVLEKCEFN